MKTHPFATYRRLFRIWQRTGEIPFRNRSVVLDPVECSSCGRTIDTPFCPHCGQPYNSSGSFFKGSFDSIPFLNDDAKRTFVHLLFRPGYMMMDYLKGKNSRYLAPLMALIIFYAFYALASSVISPDMPGAQATGPEDRNIVGNVNLVDDSTGRADSLDITNPVRDLETFFLMIRYHVF